MWQAILLVAIITALVIIFQPASLFIAGPFLLVWFISPIVAWNVSRQRSRKDFSLSDSETDFLQVISRKTWAFFEDFVVAGDNYLPPDNYQEKPIEVTAHRTSPTNIGLSTLVNLSAYDFGYISLCKLVERTQNTFNALNDMERYKGHFYNWYDTANLQPLYPRYISAVDSGNFVANMLVLRQGLLELPHDKIFNQQFYKGLHHTWKAAMQATPEAPMIFKETDNYLGRLAQSPVETLGSQKTYFEKLLQQLNVVKADTTANTNAELQGWLAKFEAQIADAQFSLSLLTPWVDLLPVPNGLEALKDLDKIPSLTEIRDLQENLLPLITELLNDAGEHQQWLQSLQVAVQSAHSHALEKLSKIEKLVNECAGFAEVEYDFLYDEDKHLFHIGYNVSEDVKDKSYYDILASEARLGIFTAIAQGKVPQDSWFVLGRLITNDGTAPVLLSWSGSMFEYLMPELVMPSYENTLLERTTRGVIQNQIDYGRKKDIPWGISESGFNLVDAHLNYQYQAFGVPGTGLKRGLGQDLVIAPYATMLALMVEPEPALKNLLLLAKNGFEGRYGFYEAVDYTPSRMPRGTTHVIIRSFMAHHQGMGFLSVARLLLGEKMQQRFERDPQFQSALLLLKEKAPKATNYYTQDDSAASKTVASHESHIRIIRTPNTTTPEVQLLSNGRYHMAISNSGVATAAGKIWRYPAGGKM
ncbi:glucoamylase family protein [Niabella hibiscisoli]|uniref:glucoamylase family protein n=1 Tax=Niabella hibiscisoli TaxID=1825928 RepID=UPI001F0FBC68|nr:glucoamylase family protein [Niabella hibiscisoli]MCH5716647.1 hypothetical protein [Niabella hibiscisoli]